MIAKRKRLLRFPQRGSVTAHRGGVCFPCPTVFPRGGSQMWSPQSLQKKVPYGGCWAAPRPSPCQRALPPSQRCGPVSRRALAQATASTWLCVTRTRGREEGCDADPGAESKSPAFPWPPAPWVDSGLDLAWASSSSNYISKRIRTTFEIWYTILGRMPYQDSSRSQISTSTGRPYFSKKPEYSTSTSGSFC